MPAEIMQELIILNYHCIKNKRESRYDVSFEDFSWQIDYLIAQGYNFLSCRKIISALESSQALTGKNVLLTFDDGDKSFLSTVYPLLKEKNIKASLFICPGLLAKPGKMSLEDIRKLPPELIEVGPHSWSHRFLIGMSKKI